MPALYFFNLCVPVFGSPILWFLLAVYVYVDRKLQISKFVHWVCPIFLLFLSFVPQNIGLDSM